MRLQGISRELEDKKVSDLVIGDIIVWNYGYKSEVVSIEYTKSKKSINLKLKSLQDGIIRDRLLRSAKLVAVPSHSLGRV